MHSTSAHLKTPHRDGIVTRNKSRRAIQTCRTRYDRFLLASGAFLLALALGGCGETGPCDFDQRRIGLDLEVAGNAGCIVVESGKLLLVRSSSGQLSIPGGRANRQESAACTAIRETREETGLEVTPSGLATVWEATGFYMFSCDARRSDSQPLEALTRVTRKLEVDEILWLEPARFDAVEWRYPGQASWLRCHLAGKEEESCPQAME